MPFWSSIPTPTPTPPTPPPAPTAIPEPAPEPILQDPTPPSKPLTRDEVADAELAELLAALDAEHEESRASSRESQNNRDGKRSQLEAEYESAFPTDMNCISAFDEMFYCYSLGGQFLNVYRYGAVRDCSEKSKDWRFCMRAKMYGPIARKAMILAHNKEKAAKYKQGASSEEIWPLRTQPLENAFSGPPEDDSQQTQVS
ncbi:hypothetical protein RUND412_006614 [Rhizina undulata]